MTNAYVCCECVTSKYFSDWIEKNGEDGQCEVNPDHSSTQKVVKSSDLAEFVDTWFRDNFVEGEQEASFDDSDRMSYEQRGELYKDILMEEMGCEEEVIQHIDYYLDQFSEYDATQGEQAFYDDYTRYESIRSVAQRHASEAEEYWYENRTYFQWRDFCNEVIHRKRFFGLKDQLDELFGSAQEFENGSICPIYNLKSGQRVYRARLLDDEHLADRVRKDPAAELGAPPRNRVRAGRMNVEFIPTFYAAFSLETAIAEIRPGIGEVAAIGEFELVRDLKVFDFTVFDRVEGDGLKQAIAHTRYDFISQIEGEISKPVLPHDKSREYIPTQIVAEYLGEYFECEAIIFRSSMINDRTKERRNIVLLNKGKTFQGEADSPLRFVSYSFREIGDILYTLQDPIPF